MGTTLSCHIRQCLGEYKTMYLLSYILYVLTFSLHGVFKNVTKRMRFTTIEQDFLCIYLNF